MVKTKWLLTMSLVEDVLQMQMTSPHMQMVQHKLSRDSILSVYHHYLTLGVILV